jgi:hypothetical protein
LRRQKRRDPRLDGLSCRGCRSDRAFAAFDGHLELLDLALRNDPRVPLLELHLGFEFVQRHLIRTLGLLKLSFGLQDIGLCHHHVGLDFRDPAARGFHRRLLG